MPRTSVAPDIGQLRSGDMPEDRPTLLPLPRSRDCLVCGRDNPHGLRLQLHVDPQAGEVRVAFTPQPHHVGFHELLHGGVTMTVIDEAMAWAAAWAGRRFCVAAELTVRFRRPGRLGRELHVSATVGRATSRLVLVSATAADADGHRVAEAEGKFVPMSPEQHAAVVAAFTDDDPAALEAAGRFVREG